jgi:serine/threonine protein kinase
VVDSGPPAPKTISHYRIVRKLGAGAMGQVFEATDRRDRSRVAVKLMWPNLAAEPGFRQRFEHEAHLASLLTSPYVVNVRQFGFEGGWPFIVMDFVDGGTLADRLRGGPLPEEEATHYALDIARGLEGAESRRVVHRDIKPENIMLSRDGRAMIADFGVARDAAGSNTMTGAFVGNATYGAPEQARGFADHRSDQYAFGAVLYHMLTGRPPFSGTFYELMRQHEEAPIPAAPLGEVSPSLRAIIQRCLAKDPNTRFANPSELVQQLSLVRRNTARLDTPPLSPVRQEPAPIVSPARAEVETAVASAPIASASPVPAPPPVLRAPSNPGTGSLGATAVAPPPRAVSSPTSSWPAAPGQAQAAVGATAWQPLVMVASAALILVAFFAVPVWSGFGDSQRTVTFLTQNLDSYANLSRGWWAFLPLAALIGGSGVLSLVRPATRPNAVLLAGLAGALGLFLLFLGWFGLATELDGYLTWRPFAGWFRHNEVRDPNAPVFLIGFVLASIPAFFRIIRWHGWSPAVVASLLGAAVVLAGFFLAPGLMYVDENKGMTTARVIREIGAQAPVQIWWAIPVLGAAIVATSLGVASGRLGRQVAMPVIGVLGAAVIAASLIGWQGEQYSDSTRWITFTGFTRNDYYYARFPAFPVMAIGAAISIAASVYGMARERRRAS